MTAAPAEALAREVERLFTLLVARRLRLGEPDPALTPAQGAALAAVVDRGPLRLGALARELGAAEPTATRIADALERHGVVERRRDQDDRRAVLLAATPAGAAALAERRRRLAELLAEPAVRLGGDTARAVALLAELNDALDATRPRAPL